MKPPRTIRGLMLFVAAIGLALGIAKSAAPYLPLILVAAIVMAPQFIVVAICSYLSIREVRMRARRDAQDSSAPQ